MSSLNVEILSYRSSHSEHVAQCWHLIDTQYMLSKLWMNEGYMSKLMAAWRYWTCMIRDYINQRSCKAPKVKWQNPKNKFGVINQDIRYGLHSYLALEKAMAPHSRTLAWKIPWTEEPGRLQSMELRTWLSDFTFTFHFYALEKEMATHSSVLAWRIPRTGEPGGLPSIELHRVGHDWSDLAAAAAYLE